MIASLALSLLAATQDGAQSVAVTPRPVSVAEATAPFTITPQTVIWTDSATLREREKWLAPLCLEHGFRMSDRLHIHLYGDTRGT